MATTELALVAPLLITITLFSMYFSELVRAKLKMLEASRFAVWELTSYVLDDYGGAAANRNDRAFAEAAGRTITDGAAKFRDLDSVADRGNGSMIAGFAGFDTRLTNLDVPMSATFDTVPPGSLPPPPRSLGGSASAVHRLFGFNQKGKVQAEVEVKLDNRILPKDFLNDSRGLFSADQWGGRSLQSVQLKARFTMIASGWQLPDGADAQMQKDEGQNGAVAGLHRGNSMHGLWRQVDRMSHLGVRPVESELIGLKTIDAASFVLPHPYNSTYVASHNYGLPDPADRECTSGRGNSDPAHPEPNGMNNLDKYSELDTPYRKCYDTAPFRDTSEYDQSLYVRHYQNRGQYFMGCINAQADDPAHAGATPFAVGDRNRRKIDCGGAGP